MKLSIFTLALFCMCCVQAAVSQGLPKQKGAINDNENDFELSTVAQLTKLVDTHRTKTGNEIVVVTTANYAPYKNIDEYATQLANSWAVGKIKNNGVLIVISEAKNEGKIVTGTALKAKLKDGACSIIVQEKMLPKFKEGNYDQAAIDAVMAITKILEGK